MAILENFEEIKMTVKIALLGFGTVASGVPFLLKENGGKINQSAHSDIKVAKVLVKDEDEKNRLLAAGNDFNFVTNVDDILSDQDITIVVELMGRIEPAKTFITRALEAGKHVVTANKDLLAVHGAELLEIAQANKVALYYEAAVAGGIPILRTLANSLASDKITRVLGVVNGTSNFMVTKMVEEGWSYDDALAEAQRLGFAESDPTNDVDGIDAAYKMVILSQFAFGMKIAFDDVAHKGIRNITPEDVAVAQELGYVVKLVGSIEETSSGIAAEVTPTFLPKAHPLASVNGVMNAVFVESIGIGESMYYGPGAGQKPTATSVVADIVRIVRRLNDGTIGKDFNEYSRDLVLANPEDVKANYYFSILALDSKGQVLKLAEIFNAQDISFKQILQDGKEGDKARVVIITHKINKAQLENVSAELKKVSEFDLLNTFKVLGE
ncbi:homoserine dehydrogenase [Streptococcus pneumoniae PCS8203]|uniref:Homoserine dehydrogenase n=8 Tax=Streptococcus TaxID=1301 RepID=Q8DPE1_STRR6|nr:Homoserine dehydrogenase [Streptococcus pneumoniae R6]ACB90602.1 homoserine dehydrogenase [Streptococcus pneumoniae CGSP14]ELU58820.1 homoserine dehydrogenase [Streptococcus pneumoniae PCS8203]ELU60012.1 homoserine dehydrogenase [Streptococcus pneumoniae PCS8106]ELU80364.1 homoserine dehydrogenase [Streptococcus pneumoniae PNI0153]ELU83969.1 homoserine dehydrogenase [Streptococcus pneumoniae PNI0076]ELU86704.1 homoserine dehydrogenase [Streptococcus pneumoniae PNI0199]ELU92776.1 homoserin